MVVVAAITSDNNQYPQDWFKIHWVTINVKTFDSNFCAIAHVWGDGILFCEAMVFHE
jgi:hypothetical protein